MLARSSTYGRGFPGEAGGAEDFFRAEVRGLQSAVVAEFRHEVPQDRVSGVDAVLGEPGLGLFGRRFYPDRQVCGVAQSYSYFASVPGGMAQAARWSNDGSS